jgi:hypothetical protein
MRNVHAAVKELQILLHLRDAAMECCTGAASINVASGTWERLQRSCAFLGC